jgi:hypothetical protein
MSGLDLFDHVAVGAVDQVVGPDAEAVYPKAALLHQAVAAERTVGVDGLDLDEGTEGLDLIEMDFDIVEEKYLSLFDDLDADAEGLGQNLPQGRIASDAAQGYIRLFGTRLVGAAVIDQGVFDVALAELEATAGAGKIGIRLTVNAADFGSLAQQNLPHPRQVGAPGLDLDIDMRHEYGPPVQSAF